MVALSRRGFLVATTATGVTALTSSVTQAAPTSEKERVKTYPASKKSAAKYAKDPKALPELALSNTYSLGKSPINDGEIITAARWGIVRAEIRGGKMTHLMPFEHDYAPTPNINGLAHLPYSESRIRYPMVREGYLKKGPKSRKGRGKERFVRVSWDQALDLVARDVNRVYDKYGPSAVFGRSYGWMSTGKVNASITLLQRVLNLRGGFIRTVNSYSTAAISTIMPYAVGVGSPKSTSWDVVLDHAKRVVFWACDPLVTNDIDWLTTLHNSAGYIRALKDKGIKTIAINPLMTDTAEYLNSEWIAPRPGTDCAMMSAMIHELERTGKADHAFLDKYTSGYPEFLKYIKGESDGVEKTPAWAEKITGVPAQKIVALAHELKDNRTMLMVGWGIQRIQYGEQSHWMAMTLAAVLGQIGLPGGGFGTNYGYSNGGSPAGFGPFMGGISAGVKPVKPSTLPWKGSTTIPVARFVDAIMNPGKVIDHNGQKVTYPEIRLIMWSGGNPFAHHPDTMRLQEAWRKPDTVVVTDTVWTATARHADIVLPAATVFEHNDITNIGTYSNDGLVAMQQAIEPQWESKSDYWIYTQLAKRFGFEQAFTEGLDEMGWIKKLYENSRQLGARMGRPLPTFEQFWKQGYVLYDVKPESRQFVAFEKFRKDPVENSLDTESGKLQIFSPKIASYNYKDCLGHPSYLPPTEGVNARTKELPLALMAPKSRYRMHSQLDGTLSHDFAHVEGREPCWIHPDDAKARGIENGDVLKVYNKRGTLLAGAFVTNRVMPGVVVIHHGAWFDPQATDDGYMDVRGNSNTLTMDVPTSKLACGNIASTANVQVEKFTGELPHIIVHEQPRQKRG